MPITYLKSPSVNPYFNLALEQYVFDRLPRDRSYFMLWQNDNAIIVGKHQNTIEELNTDYVEARGISVVRRLSGGGAVYHDLGNINFTFIADAGQMDSLDMKLFCQPVVRALAAAGVTAQISGRNDITIDGQKFSGNSQYIKEGRVLHHGTLLFDSDLTVLSSALKASPDKIESKGIRSVRARVTNIRPHLPRDMSLPDFTLLLSRHMADSALLERYELTARDKAEIEALRHARYDTWQWNYGASPRYSLRKARRIEGFGSIQVYMEVSKGRITAFETFGDYFGSGDGKDVARALAGCRPERGSLLAALSGLEIDRYFSGLTREQLIDIILL